MSDNTTVYLTLLKSDFENNSNLFDGYDEIGIPPTGTSEKLIYIEYYDVNFGNIGIEANLLNLKIPHDKRWDEGSDYSRGIESYRVLADGTEQFIEINGSTEAVVSLDVLLAVYESGDIDGFIASKKQEMIVIEWDEQIAIREGVKVITPYDDLTCDDFIVWMEYARQCQVERGEDSENISPEETDVQARMLYQEHGGIMPS